MKRARARAARAMMMAIGVSSEEEGKGGKAIRVAVSGWQHRQRVRWQQR